jgi:DNA-binding MarR family transcriptional regulator
MALVTDLHIARLLQRALREVQAEYFDRLQTRGHPGVRTGHIPVFAGIEAGGTRITDLADRGGMTRQMMGRLVRELETLGYVRTAGDPADQRAVIVTLTRRGRSLGAEAAEIIRELEGEYADRLGDPGLASLRTALATIIDHTPAAAAGDPAAAPDSPSA